MSRCIRPCQCAARAGRACIARPAPGSCRQRSWVGSVRGVGVDRQGGLGQRLECARWPSPAPSRAGKRLFDRARVVPVQGDHLAADQAAPDHGEAAVVDPGDRRRRRSPDSRSRSRVPIRPANWSSSGCWRRRGRRSGRAPAASPPRRRHLRTSAQPTAPAAVRGQRHRPASGRCGLPQGRRQVDDRHTVVARPRGRRCSQGRQRSSPAVHHPGPAGIGAVGGPVRRDDQQRRAAADHLSASNDRPGHRTGATAVTSCTHWT